MQVTVEQFANALNLAQATVRRQIANGRLKATKRGRDWDIPDDEIVRYRAESLGQPGRRRATLNLGLID
jgi:excisionase family DNA binding protein